MKVKKKSKKRTYIILGGILLLLLVTGITSAETFGYNYLKQGEDLNPSINYSTINVNNSQYLQGYTPTTLKDWMQGLFDSVYCKLTGCVMTGNLTTSGNISASYFFGDGSQLTGISGSGNASWNQSLADTLYSPIGSGTQSYWLNTSSFTYINSSIAPTKINVSGITSKGEGLRSEQFGYGANASDNDDLAIGYNAKSTWRSVAIGKDAEAIGYEDNSRGSVAIGYQAIANDTLAHSQTAIGYKTKAIGSGCTSIGAESDCQSTGGVSTIIGQLSMSNKSGCTGIGYGVQCAGENSIAIGRSVSISSGNGIAIGINSIVKNAYTVSIGAYSRVLGERSVAFGYNAIADGADSVVVGFGATTLSGYIEGVALGRYATIGEHRGIAIGHNAEVSASSGIALGGGTNASEYRSFVVGSDRSGSQNGITDVYIGNGIYQSAPLSATYHGSGGRGTNIYGANITFAGGKATGNATGGSILFQTSNAGASGTTSQSLTTKAIILNNGYMGIGTTNPTYPLTVFGNNTGISIWSDGNVSASGYMTRTSIWKDEYGSVWNYIKPKEELKGEDEDGKDKIKHELLSPNVIKHNISVKVGKELQPYIEQEFTGEVIRIGNETDGYYETPTRNVTKWKWVDVYEEKEVEGVLLDDMTAKHDQALWELKQEIEDMKKELCKLGSIKYC